MVGMVAAAAPVVILILVADPRGALGYFLLVALSAASGIVSGATLGAHIADRRQETGSTALLKGAGMAVWGSVIFHGLFVALCIVAVGWSVVSGDPSGSAGVMGVLLYWPFLLLVSGVWTAFVGIPAGAIAGLVLHTIGGKLAAADAADAAGRRSR